MSLLQGYFVQYYLALFEFIVAAVVWAVTYNLSPFQYLRLAAIMIIRDYLATGVVVATLLW